MGNLPADIYEEDYVPRLSDELLYEILKYRLNLSDCLNRGYILDGYPRSFNDSVEILVNKTEIPAPLSENPEDEPQEPAMQIKEDLNMKIAPQCVISLEALPEWIKQSITKNVPAET